MPKIGLLLFSICLVCRIGLPAQQTSIGIELEGYPAGIILGLDYQKPLGDAALGSIKISYNHIRRKDFGVHDDERGYGVGITASYYQRPFKGHVNILLGLRSDIWYSVIHWKDINSTFNGTTKITVLQPTAYLGYQIARWRPFVSLGQEINIRTVGQGVGQGTILLLGLRVGV